MNKKVIITGASSGIGAELAKQFYAQGFDVGVMARREDKLSELTATLQGKGCAYYQTLDLNKDHDVQKNIDALIEQLGGLDIMIANAGMIDVAATGKGLLATHKHVIQVNLIGAIATIDAASEFFRQQGHGHLVGVSSVSAYRGIPGSAAYSSAKAALSNYLQAVRTELINKNIRVTTIHPGFINTQFAKNMSKYPFVIEADAAAKTIIKGVLKNKKDVIVPRFPWALLKHILPLLPEYIIRRIF